MSDDKCIKWWILNKESLMKVDLTNLIASRLSFHEASLSTDIIVQRCLHQCLPRETLTTGGEMTKGVGLGVCQRYGTC